VVVWEIWDEEAWFPEGGRTPPPPPSPPLLAMVDIVNELGPSGEVVIKGSVEDMLDALRVFEPASINVEGLDDDIDDVDVTGVEVVSTGGEMLEVVDDWVVEKGVVVVVVVAFVDKDDVVDVNAGVGPNVAVVTVKIDHFIHIYHCNKHMF